MLSREVLEVQQIQLGAFWPLNFMFRWWKKYGSRGRSRKCPIIRAELMAFLLEGTLVIRISRGENDCKVTFCHQSPVYTGKSV